MICILDFETYWDSKDYTLSKMNVIDYVRSPKFYPQMVAISVDFAEPVVYEHADILPALLALHLEDTSVMVIGHNINGFDGLVLSEHYGIHPACILDTITMMRWTGVSRVCREGLKDVAQWFGIGEKKPGTVVSDGKRTKAEFEPGEWEYFKQYCADDVRLTAGVAKQMLPYMTGGAILFSNLTAKMATEPGFIINPAPLHTYLEELDAKARATQEELQHIFKFEDNASFLKAVRSDKQFCGMLRFLDLEPPMKVSEKKTATYRATLEEERKTATPERAAEIDKLLADPEKTTVLAPALAKGDLDFLDLLDNPDERVRTLVQARLDLKTSVPKTRGENLLHFADGRPVPVLLKCFSAHTSRYAAGSLDAKSDGLQWQNIPKHRKDMRALRESIHVPDGYSIVACDSSQIEARVLAYEAQQLDLLDHFAHGRDVYSEQAATFGYDMTAQEIHDGAKSGNKKAKMLRQVGKKLILSCGYGTGWAKLADTLLREKVHLAEEVAEHRMITKRLHTMYRNTNGCITAFWDTCQNIISALANGDHGFFGGPKNDLFEYGMVGICGKEPVPTITLPTGYMLRYPGLTMQANAEGKYEYIYKRVLGRNVVDTRLYGGALTENLTQALAFQILMAQALAMSSEGIKIYVNVHDSFSTIVRDKDVQDTKAIMLKCMSAVPPFVEGLPLACEAEVAKDFTIC